MEGSNLATPDRSRAGTSVEQLAPASRGVFGSTIAVEEAQDMSFDSRGGQSSPTSPWNPAASSLLTGKGLAPVIESTEQMGCVPDIGPGTGDRPSAFQAAKSRRHISHSILQGDESMGLVSCTVSGIEQGDPTTSAQKPFLNPANVDTDPLDSKSSLTIPGPGSGPSPFKEEKLAIHSTEQLVRIERLGSQNPQGEQSSFSIGMPGIRKGRRTAKPMGGRPGQGLPPGILAKSTGPVRTRPEVRHNGTPWGEPGGFKRRKVIQEDVEGGTQQGADLDSGWLSHYGLNDSEAEMLQGENSKANVLKLKRCPTNRGMWQVAKHGAASGGVADVLAAHEPDSSRPSHHGLPDTEAVAPQADSSVQQGLSSVDGSRGSLGMVEARSSLEDTGALSAPVQEFSKVTGNRSGLKAPSENLELAEREQIMVEGPSHEFVNLTAAGEDGLAGSVSGLETKMPRQRILASPRATASRQSLASPRSWSRQGPGPVRARGSGLVPWRPIQRSASINGTSWGQGGLPVIQSKEYEAEDEMNAGGDVAETRDDGEPRTAYKRQRRSRSPGEDWDERRLERSVSPAESCHANVLIVRGDRGWREKGAIVELHSGGEQGAGLAVVLRGEVLATVRPEQSVATAASSRYTQSMIWRGEKGWSLEFDERKEWHRFRDMHEECYQLIVKAAAMKRIPIPGVTKVADYHSEDLEPAFIRPAYQYIETPDGEAQLALPDCTRIVYDMDSEDEEWLRRTNQGRVSGLTDEVQPISEEMFEKLMDRLEKDSHTLNEPVPLDMALRLMEGVAPEEVMSTVHGYWYEKRTKKGMALIRHFQPPPWEQYQNQLAAWQTKIQHMMQQQPGVTRQQLQHQYKRPPIFAFCLRPRGLHQDKLQRQRSQKKTGQPGGSADYAVHGKAGPGSPGVRRGLREANEAAEAQARAMTEPPYAVRRFIGRKRKLGSLTGTRRNKGRPRAPRSVGRGETTALDLAGAFKAVARQNRLRPPMPPYERSKYEEPLEAEPSAHESPGASVPLGRAPGDLARPSDRLARLASVRRARRGAVSVSKVRRNGRRLPRSERKQPLLTMAIAVPFPEQQLGIPVEDGASKEAHGGSAAQAVAVVEEPIGPNEGEATVPGPGQHKVLVGPALPEADGTLDDDGAVSAGPANGKCQPKRRDSWLKPKKRVNKREQRMRLMAAAAASKLKRRQRQLEQQRELELLQQQLGLGAPDAGMEEEEQHEELELVTTPEGQQREAASEDQAVASETASGEPGNSPPVLAVYQRRADSRGREGRRAKQKMAGVAKDGPRGARRKKATIAVLHNDEPLSVISEALAEGGHPREATGSEANEAGRKEWPEDPQEARAAAKAAARKARAKRAAANELFRRADMALQRAVAALAFADALVQAEKAAEEVVSQQLAPLIKRPVFRELKPPRSKPVHMRPPLASPSAKPRTQKRRQAGLKKKKKKGKVKKAFSKVRRGQPAAGIEPEGAVETSHANGGVTELVGVSSGAVPPLESPHEDSNPLQFSKLGCVGNAGEQDGAAEPDTGRDRSSGEKQEGSLQGSGEAGLMKIPSQESDPALVPAASFPVGDGAQQVDMGRLKHLGQIEPGANHFDADPKQTACLLVLQDEGNSEVQRAGKASDIPETAERRESIAEEGRSVEVPNNRLDGQREADREPGTSAD